VKMRSTFICAGMLALASTTADAGDNGLLCQVAAKVVKAVADKLLTDDVRPILCAPEQNVDLTQVYFWTKGGIAYGEVHLSRTSLELDEAPVSVDAGAMIDNTFAFDHVWLSIGGVIKDVGKFYANIMLRRPDATFTDPLLPRLLIEGSTPATEETQKLRYCDWNTRSVECTRRLQRLQSNGDNHSPIAIITSEQAEQIFLAAKKTSLSQWQNGMLLTGEADKAARKAVVDAAIQAAKRWYSKSPPPVEAALPGRPSLAPGPASR
jgi:hypothetical protein